MNKIICQLRVAFEPPYILKQEEKNIRYKQYFDGLKKFVEFNFKENNCDVFLLDNTLSNIKQIPKDILEILDKNNIEVILTQKNNFGKYNKGAGDIENLIEIKEKLKNYEWFIHFEPRQLLLSHEFFISFLKEERNLFTLNKNKNAAPHFNTGLYACRTKDILSFIENFDNIKLENMVKNSISIEYILYQHFNNIKYYTLDKMDLLWFNTSSVHHM